MNARLVIAALVLSSCIALPWAWFHVGVRPPESVLALTVRPSVHGFEFKPDKLSTEVLGLLATTNVLNGTFMPKGARGRVIAFSAEWSPTEGVGRTIVNHTPDVCWVNSGWAPVDVGQPNVQDIELSGLKVPFECRVFESGARDREVTIWCTLVNGEPQVEPFRFRSATAKGGRVRAALNLSRLALGRFSERIQKRYPATGTKQFVRLSMPLGTDVHSTLAELGAFAGAWISVTKQGPG